MASLERTAYPVFAPTYSGKELQRHFTLNDEEVAWVKAKTPYVTLRLSLGVLLKCFQYLRYFPPVDDIPTSIIQHIRSTLGCSESVEVDYSGKNTLYRHTAAIRDWLRIKSAYGQAAKAAAQAFADAAAEQMDQRTDIINAVIEDLIQARYELPAFSTLDEIAEKAHAAVQTRIFDTVQSRISASHLYCAGRAIAYSPAAAAMRRWNFWRCIGCKSSLPISVCPK